MEKNVLISMLLDFYGDILTEKQRDVIDLYYNEDLSLSEIAMHSSITRQGVRDSIKRAEAVLLSMEDKLGLLRRYNETIHDIEKIIEYAKVIENLNSRFTRSIEIGNAAQGILELTARLTVNH